MIEIAINNSIPGSLGLPIVYLVNKTLIRMPVDILDGSKAVVLALWKSNRCKRAKI